MDVLQYVGQEEGFTGKMYMNTDEDHVDMEIHISIRGKITRVYIDDFLTANWIKLIALLDYTVQPEHRWIEKLVFDSPHALFCSPSSFAEHKNR